MKNYLAWLCIHVYRWWWLSQKWAFFIFNLELLLGLLKDLYILFWLSITWSWMDYYLAWWAGHFGMLWSSAIHMPLVFRFNGLSLYFILFFNLFYFLTCNNNVIFYSQFRKEIKISLSLSLSKRLQERKE